MAKLDFVRRAQTVATLLAGVRAECDALKEVVAARDYGAGQAAAIADADTGGAVPASNVHALLDELPALLTALNAAKRAINRMRNDL